MAITIDYSDTATPKFVIQIPRADMALVQTVPSEIRQLNLDSLRIELGGIQDSAPGMPYSTAFNHTAPLTISGVTLARVVEVLDPYTITFQNGLYNVNIVGGNSNVSDVTNKNQVGVNTANSAGLQDPFSLQAASFDGEVAINTVDGTSGTVFPIGTRGFPSNNMADADRIADQRGFRTFRILDDLTLSAGDFSDGHTFVGDNPNILLTIDGAVNITSCSFETLTVQGDLDSDNILRECALLDLNFFSGFIFQCGLAGTIHLSGTSTAAIMQSFSLVAGAGAAQYPIIDCGGAMETPLAIRDFSGGLGFTNCTSQTAPVSVDMSSGRCVFESSIAAGTFAVRGIAEVQDDSTGTATVVDQTLTGEVGRVRKHATNRFETDPTTGVATLYDDDGSTPLETTQLYEDVNGAQDYRGLGAERRDGFS